jgi:hypothetical protein
VNGIDGLCGKAVDCTHDKINKMAHLEMLEQSEIDGCALANVNSKMGKYSCILREITVVHVSVNRA